MGPLSQGHCFILGLLLYFYHFRATLQPEAQAKCYPRNLSLRGRCNCLNVMSTCIHVFFFLDLDNVLQKVHEIDGYKLEISSKNKSKKPTPKPRTKKKAELKHNRVNENEEFQVVLKNLYRYV